MTRFTLMDLISVAAIATIIVGVIIPKFSDPANAVKINNDKQVKTQRFSPDLRRKIIFQNLPVNQPVYTKDTTENILADSKMLRK